MIWLSGSALWFGFVAQLHGSAWWSGLKQLIQLYGQALREQFSFVTWL
jgi:hypothetical protein